MNSVTWNPFIMLLYREIRRFGKVVVQTVLTPLINSSLYLLIFGVSLGENIKLNSGLSYLAFIIPGLVMMGVLNNSYQNSSATITSGKFSGELQDLKVTPLSFHQIIWALALGGLIRGLIVGTITLGVGQVFYFYSEGLFLDVASPVILGAFVFVGGLAFAMLGISVAFWAKTFDQLSAVSSFVLTPLIYLGGVFFTIENLHPFWKSVSMANPLFYMINGVRSGILGASDVSVGSALAFTCATLIVFYLIAFQSLRKASFSKW